MKCKGKPLKFLMILVLGLTAVNLSVLNMDQAVTHSELKKDTHSCFPHHQPATPGEMLKNTLSGQTSNPLDRVFQIIFILFIVSPPLIVLLLFLIWRELKTRNKLR